MNLSNFNKIGVQVHVVYMFNTLQICTNLKFKELRFLRDFVLMNNLKLNSAETC